MKNIFKNNILLLTAFMLGCLIISCEDDSEVYTANETQPITLAELPITSIDLDAANPGNPAVTFSWNEANYGQPAAESYSILIASDQGFTNSTLATTVSGTTSTTLSVNELNAAVGAVGLPPFEFGTVYARIESSLGTQTGLPVNSNTITFDVRPYFNYLFDDYYIVGNGTAADWNNNNNNPPLFRDAENSNIYTYTGFFTKGGGGFDDGRFKLLEIRGQWQPQWGVAADEGSDDIMSSGAIAGNPATQDNDPGRFGVTQDGYYRFMVNFSDMTYTMDPFNEAGSTTFTSMTLQGSGVSADTAFTQSSFDSHIWFISNVILQQSGELQIVTNSGSTWAGPNAFSGVATEGGDSIPVAVQDEYEVWFNDLTGDYIMIPLNL